MKRMSVKTIRFLMVMIFAVTFAISFSPIQQGQAAAATAASLEVSGGSTFYEGEIILIKVYDVTASGDFSLQVDSSILYNSTAPATGDTTIWYQWKAAQPATGEIRTLAVYDASVNSLAAKDIFVYEPDDAIPSDLITELGVAIFAVLIIVMIVTGMLYGKRQ
jgi:hypothetical protein